MRKFPHEFGKIPCPTLQHNCLGSSEVTMWGFQSTLVAQDKENQSNREGGESVRMRNESSNRENLFNKAFSLPLMNSPKVNLFVILLLFL